MPVATSAEIQKRVHSAAVAALRSPALVEQSDQRLMRVDEDTHRAATHERHGAALVKLDQPATVRADVHLDVTRANRAGHPAVIDDAAVPRGAEDSEHDSPSMHAASVERAPQRRLIQVKRVGFKEN